MERHEHGRSLLRSWEDTKPANFYTDDRYLRRLLSRRVASERLCGAARAEAFRGLVQAQRAGIVAEPLPRGQDL